MRQGRVVEGRIAGDRDPRQRRRSRGAGLEVELRRIRDVLDAVVAADRGYRDAAAARAVRITELTIENEALRRSTGTAGATGGVRPSQVTAEQALRSFRRAESRIKMLERENARKDAEIDALRAQHRRLRNRRSVRVALALTAPLVALRRAASSPRKSA